MSDELVRQLLLRVQSKVPGARIVTPDEVAEWPEGALDALVREGVLQASQPATTVECDACFEGHIEVVEFVEEPPGSAPRAYIACPEFGRVKVSPQRMRRWEIQPRILEQHVPHESITTADSRAHSRTSVWPPTAEAFVETLRQAQDSGAPYLRWWQIKERLEAKGHHPNRTRDVRRNVPDWDEVIASPRRGIYKLKS
jgi:hypothetical protein